MSSAFAALPRTYENALRLLGQLSTNREVTALFEAPAGADLNAQAMPQVRAWLARAGYGDVERDLAGLRCVHVAGTKGKGSVCALVTAILTREGAPGVGRVGTYLSPHVVSVRERIWLDGRPIGRGLFARYTFELWERLSAAAGDAADAYGPTTKPFYFRFLTLLALHVFVSEKVRSAVVECGIGGEYDVTNVLPAAAVTAAGVTRLGIDHVAMLGRTPAAIAWHKAGVFKPGAGAYTLQPDTPEACETLPVLRARARERGTVLREISPAHVDRWKGVPRAALHGAFQKHNMALAGMLARHHLAVLANSEIPDDLDPAALPPRFLEAMAMATLRGRCEAVTDLTAPVHWTVDGAHTADSLAEVARYFAAQPGTDHTCLVFTVKDRDAAQLLRTLLASVRPGFFGQVLVILPAEAAEAQAAVLEAVAETSPSSRATVWQDAASAVQQVRADAKPGCRALATGSFVLARDVLRVVDALFEE